MGFLARVAVERGTPRDRHTLTIGRDVNAPTIAVETPAVIATEKTTLHDTAARQGGTFMGAAILGRYRLTAGITPKHEIRTMEGDPERLILFKP
jgi:hypothetical protein